MIHLFRCFLDHFQYSCCFGELGLRKYFPNLFYCQLVRIQKEIGPLLLDCGRRQILASHRQLRQFQEVNLQVVGQDISKWIAQPEIDMQMRYFFKKRLVQYANDDRRQQFVISITFTHLFDVKTGIVKRKTLTQP